VANQLAGNPWVLDGTNLGTVLISTWIKVEHFEFSGYAANTDKVVLADRNGNIVWQGTAASDLEEVRSGKVGWINGLQELTHTSGKALVYYD